MTTKNATIRLPEDLADWMTSDGKSINQAVIDCALFLRRIRQVSMGEINGVFTSTEWKLFADSLSGTAVEETFRCNVGAFIAHCEDADKYDLLGQKWNVDMDLLKQKIRKLSGANVDAIYTSVEKLWADANANIDDWANFLKNLFWTTIISSSFNQIKLTRKVG